MRRLAVLLFLALPALAASEVVSGVHLIRGGFTPGSQPDGNTVIFTAPEGLIVVDTGRHVAHTQAIADFASAAKQPVKTIVNTHWHLDHVGGNVLLRRTFPGVRVYASGALSDAMTGFLANYKKQLEQMLKESPDAKSFRAELDLIESGAQLAPDEVVTKSAARTFAGRELAVNLEQNAVTAGDLWILDRATGVLVAGDLVTLPAPFLDTACPAKWMASLDRIARSEFELLIPGHGAPMTRRQFETYRRAFGNLLKCEEKKICIDGWLSDTAALTSGENATFTRQLMEYYADLMLRKRGSEC